MTYKACEVIESACDECDYGLEKIETLARSADQTAKVIGRLVQVLYDRRIISNHDVYNIAGWSIPNELTKEVLK